MQYKVVKAKSYEEAIEKSGLKIGQLARITDIKASGNTDGLWTVCPSFEPIEEKTEVEVKLKTVEREYRAFGDDPDINNAARYGE